jgi:hypothetical protein
LRPADGMVTAARAVLVLALLLASAGAASAAETIEGCESKPLGPFSQTSRPTGIGADVGLASAVGFAGLTVTRAFAECFRIELGGGIGFSGWQLSLMPKLAFDLAHGVHYLVIGAGVSVAFPKPESLASVATGHPVWLNVDALGYEVRDQYGLSLAFAIGVTRGLGGGQVCQYVVECNPAEDLEDVSDYWNFQTRIQVAYWF